VAIFRYVQIDLAAARYLVWEWKVRRLPDGGDVRVPTRNDQAARVMVLFGHTPEHVMASLAAPRQPHC
jgi:hypothetical protein